MIFVPPVVTDEAAGAAELLTVVLLLVVSAFEIVVLTVSRLIAADTAAETRPEIFCLVVFATWVKFFLFYPRFTSGATHLLSNAHVARALPPC